MDCFKWQDFTSRHIVTCFGEGDVHAHSPSSVDAQGSQLYPSVIGIAMRETAGWVHGLGGGIHGVLVDYNTQGTDVVQLQGRGGRHTICLANASVSSSWAAASHAASAAAVCYGYGIVCDVGVVSCAS
jgi:hypothetical protein